MIDLSGNIKMTFGAKYMAEDTASYILYKFDRTSLDGRAVPVEKLARFLGLDVYCEYLSGDCEESLGTLAYEPQRIYTYDGKLDLTGAAAVVERDIIDRGESSLYRLTLALMCSHYLFHIVKKGEERGEQLSFGFDTVASENKKDVTLSAAVEEIDGAGSGVANFALKLVMPKNGFKRAALEVYAALGINRATIDPVKHLPAVLAELSERYDLPEAVVLARLHGLNLY